MNVLAFAEKVSIYSVSAVKMVGVSAVSVKDQKWAFILSPSERWRQQLWEDESAFYPLARLFGAGLLTGTRITEPLSRTESTLLSSMIEKWEEDVSGSRTTMGSGIKAEKEESSQEAGLMQPQMVAMQLQHSMHQGVKSFSRSLVIFCAKKRGLQGKSKDDNVSHANRPLLAWSL